MIKKTPILSFVKIMEFGSCFNVWTKWKTNKEMVCGNFIRKYFKNISKKDKIRIVFTKKKIKGSIQVWFDHNGVDRFNRPEELLWGKTKEEANEFLFIHLNDWVYKNMLIGTEKLTPHRFYVSVEVV